MRDYAKIAIAAVLLVMLIFVSVQIAEFAGRASEARAKYEAAKAKLDEAGTDQQKLKEDLDYYSNPANILKEMRARFNYILPGEKTIILVPSPSST